jgi:hypothetical protein
MVTVRTSVSFPEDYISDEFFKIILLLIDYPQINRGCIICKSFSPFDTFGIRMDVMVIKKTENLQALRPEDFNRIY